MPISKYVGSIPVSYSSLGYHAGSVNFEIKLAVLLETRIKWQQETFKTIIDAYEKALTAYEEKLAVETAKKINPGSYRQIENMVLRKNCISYLIDQDTAAKRTYGKDMGKPLGNGIVKNFGNHEIKVDTALDDYAAFAKFMEQAFEWDIMSYNFYPYYWGARTEWAKLYQYENNDPLFRSFMQAGMARVVVTVRPGFEKAVGYYLQTGQIWNGGEVPVIEDALFLSIVDELEQPAGQKEGKAWSTRLPTALTILQAGNIGLKVDKALPYDKDLSDFEDPDTVPKSSNFYISKSQLNERTGKTVEFTYQTMDYYTTIADYDMHNNFPKIFNCMGEEITIQRDASWYPANSSSVIYKKLAEQLSHIPGIKAKQFTSDFGNGSGIRFTIDTSLIPVFSFTKALEGSYSPSSELDAVMIFFYPEAVKVITSTQYSDRILDANGTELTGAEVNTLLPISRFLV
jgi:hypothetical protein